MKKYRFLILSIGIIISICLIFIAYCNISVIPCENELNNNRYLSASICYAVTVNKQVKEDLNRLYKEKINNMKKQYNEDEITYKEAEVRLKTISKNSYFLKEVSEALQEIQELKLSNEAYESGIMSMKEDDYKKAINNFMCVLESDVKNYKKSQLLINECILFGREECKFSIDKCYINYNRSNLKDIYKDQIQIKLTNNFDNSIKNFTVCFIGFDNNHNPVVIDCDSNLNKTYYIVCMAQNVNINPSTTWGDGTMGWNINNADNIYTIEANVKEIEFDNGESWDNPLYDLWIQNRLNNIW